GSCTNGRTSDFIAAAELLRRAGRRVPAGVRALAVPGSQRVRDEVVGLRIDRGFPDAGFEFPEPGRSPFLALHSHPLEGDQARASSSNRTFKGRQGSPTGRTLLMSPTMVAAAALAGAVTDVRDLISSA